MIAPHHLGMTKGTLTGNGDLTRKYISSWPNSKLIYMSGYEEQFICACAKVFRSKRALAAHCANTNDGDYHYPAG